MIAKSDQDIIADRVVNPHALTPRDCFNAGDPVRIGRSNGKVTQAQITNVDYEARNVTVVWNEGDNKLTKEVILQNFKSLLLE